MGLDASSAIRGKNYYRLLYQAELEQESEWLRRCSAEKAKSIEILTKRNYLKPCSIIELGCGVGAVINECKVRNIANRYMGIDYSREAIDYAKTHCEGIEFIHADITDPSFCMDNKFDILVLSHVIEHLECPNAFLSALRQSLEFSYAVIEVPLEDLLIGRLKDKIADYRTTNKAGHVNFFTIASFENLLISNGLEIVDRRTYVPVLDWNTIRFVCEKEGLSNTRQVVKVIGNLLPLVLSPLWKKLYYAHHAVLCVAP